MGFSLFGKRIRNGVPGTAQVVSCTAHGGHATHQTCKMNLVVQAVGVPAFSTEHSCIVKATKWPSPGETLPVTIDADDPSRFRIEWDEVLEADDVARANADALAAALRGEGSAPAGAGVPFGGATIVGTPRIQMGATGEAYDPSNPEHRAALDAAEAALGVDLDGDGSVAGRGAAPGPAAGSDGGDQRVAALERLAALHASGALTDAEFAAEKRRLLES